MEFKNIVEKKNCVIISLNRPDVLNSFNYAMADDFLAFDDAEKIVRAILLLVQEEHFVLDKIWKKPLKKMDLALMK